VSLAEAQSAIAQVDPVPAQTAEEITDPSELEILASELPMASQMLAPGLQQSMDQYDIASRLIECQTENVGADCMKTSGQSRLPSSFSQHRRQQQVATEKMHRPAARQSPMHDMQETTSQLTQVGEQSMQVQRPDALNVLPEESFERQIPPSMFTTQEHSSADAGALLAWQQQELESIERTGQQETVPYSPRNLPLEEEALVREAQRLEENQQQLQRLEEHRQQLEAQRLKQQQQQMQRLEEQQQLMQYQVAQLQNLEQQQRRREYHQSSNTYDKHDGRDDVLWLTTAPAAEERDYFSRMVSSKNDVRDRTLGVEPLSVEKPVGSQLRIPADIKSPIHGTQLQIPAANTSAEANSLEVQSRL
jgi:hypothetical protein